MHLRGIERRLEGSPQLAWRRRRKRLPACSTNHMSNVVVEAAQIAERTFTRADIEHTNEFGFSALGHARTRGLAFEAALSAISVEAAP